MISSSLSFLNNITELKSGLKQVESQILSYIKIDDKEVATRVENSLSSGKMVRPSITLLFSLLTKNKIDDNTIKLASAIEVLHNATLIHDDIVDNSDTRRSQPTLNALYMDDVAVYSGDLLPCMIY